MSNSTVGPAGKFHAVIFDLDGTLVDSLADLANATNYAMGQLDCPQHRADDYRYMVGAGRRELCRRALPDDRHDLLDQAETLMTQYYAQHCFDYTVMYPGVPELLGELNARGITLAILSNKPDKFVQLTASKLLGDFRFAAVAGQSDPIPHKPAPDGALHIAKILNIAPDQFLYLGDSGIDMQTAVNADMYPVGATWGFRKADELTQAGARALIDHPGDLLRFFS